MSSNQHLAAILPAKGSLLEVSLRPTPTPGPKEVVIAVKSIAFNPFDGYQRDHGYFLTHYPAVLGSDIAGTIIATGSAITSPDFQPGTRVTAFATCYYAGGEPNYGAFQAHVLVPASNVAPIPESLTFNEACILPMAVSTACAGWYTIGLPMTTRIPAAEKKGLLVWGGASSIGSAAVQTAKIMGFEVYVTASEKHHAYMKTLGASHTFDYKDADVIEKIIKTANEAGLTIAIAYGAVPGSVIPCQEVLKSLKGDEKAMIASAPRLSEDTPKVEGIEAKFVSAPEDAQERTEHFTSVFNVWLKEKLATGEFVPSPKVQVVGSGLDKANVAIDLLVKGVSGVKLVVEI